MGFVTACSNFFGKLPGESMAEFAVELRALTPADREEMAPMLAEALGTPVEP